MTRALISFSLLWAMAGVGAKAEAAKHRAVRVEVAGKIMAPDSEFNNRVLLLLKDTLVKRTVVEGEVLLHPNPDIVGYSLESIGFEGGQSFCIETSSISATRQIRTNFEKLVSEVPLNTTYTVELRERCA